MKLAINNFSYRIKSDGLYTIAYVCPKSFACYTSVTTDSKLIDATFNCEHPTQRNLSELRKACKK